MADMIDLGAIISGAKMGSDFLDVPVFQRGMGAYRRGAPQVDPSYVGEATVSEGGFSLGETPVGNPGNVVAMNTEYQDLNAQDQLNSDNLGGVGGDMRAPGYAPGSGEGYVFNENPVQEQPQAIEEQMAQIEAIAQNGTIEQLLEALRDMASMEPGRGNPVFQLDAAYKNSSALGGLPGTVAQYPMAGGMTRETEYSF